METSIEQEKQAVLSGYFNIYRFDPNKTPSMTIDLPMPSKPYADFIMSQSRYFTLSSNNPDRAKTLFADAESFAKKRLEKLKG